MPTSDRIKRNRRRQRAKAVLGATTTTCVLIGAVAAVAFGAGFLENRAEAGGGYVAADALPVQVAAPQIKDGFTLTRAFTGQVEATQSAGLSFERGGLLQELTVDEGQWVNAGDVIARLDTRLLDAETDQLLAARAALEAQLDFALSRVARAESLRSEGFASDENLEQATAIRDELQSGIEELTAALMAVEINKEKSVLVAPFSGQVGSQLLNEGETVAAGLAVIDLIEKGPSEVRVGVPLSLDLDTLQSVRIAIDGTSYPATIAQVRPDIDPVTRTRTILFEVDADQPFVIGQTAVLAVETFVPMQGTWVTFDALSAGANGAWSILVVDEDDTVRRAAVEILHSTDTAAYVRGTFPATSRMVMAGAHRVVPGQLVSTQTAGL